MSKITASELIKVAKSQVGYLEKASNNNLDDFTKNAGSNNYTKYARDYATFAGVNLQAQSWCDMFVDWCFVESFGAVKAKELLGGFNAYTPSSAQYFKNMNRWYTSNPKVGDVIFFKNSDRICHTGIVVNVNNSTVYTIEGNTSDGKDVIPNGGEVCEKNYLLSNSRIAGYGRPKYDEETTSTTKTDDWVKRLQKVIGVTQDNIAGSQTLSKCPVIQSGSKGDVAKLLQERLTSLGYDTKGVDGEIGTNSIASIKAYQKANKLTTDGVFGQNSWKKILGLS